MIFFVVISNHLRLDKGTETGEMATIHAFVRETQGDIDEAADTVHYGPSTSNKVCYSIDAKVAFCPCVRCPNKAFAEDE